MQLITRSHARGNSSNAQQQAAAHVPGELLQFHELIDREWPESEAIARLCCRCVRRQRVVDNGLPLRVHMPLLIRLLLLRRHHAVVLLRCGRWRLRYGNSVKHVLHQRTTRAHSAGLRVRRADLRLGHVRHRDITCRRRGVQRGDGAVRGFKALRQQRRCSALGVSR